MDDYLITRVPDIDNLSLKQIRVLDLPYDKEESNRCEEDGVTHTSCSSLKKF